jgi:hypothetical protein
MPRDCLSKWYMSRKMTGRALTVADEIVALFLQSDIS